MTIAPSIESPDAAPGRASAQLATRDVVEGLKTWRIWVRLAWHDIQTRYHRTLLGPFWITINTAVVVVGLGLVFSAIFHNDITTYLPYLAAGQIAWTMISSNANEAPQVFVGAHGIIRSLSLPFTVHVHRMWMRNLIIFFHSFAAFEVIGWFWNLPFNLHILHLVPGLILVCANGVWLSLLLAMLGARYRDLQQIVLNVFQFAFYLTPIIWSRDLIPNGRLYWVDANPLYHAVEMIRAPMLGQAPAPLSYVCLCVMALLGNGVAFLLFRVYRREITYWV